MARRRRLLIFFLRKSKCRGKFMLHSLKEALARARDRCQVFIYSLFFLFLFLSLSFIFRRRAHVLLRAEEGSYVCARILPKGFSILSKERENI